MYVHGDDYVSTGMPEQLQWPKQKLEEQYQVKTQAFGHEKEHLTEVKALNVIIGWDGSKGISYEADPRHIEIIVKQLGLNDSKFVSTPGAKEEGRTQAGQ